jgi:subtilase family serine protease
VTMPKSYIRHPRAAIPRPWSIDALARAYDWPTGLAGGGVIGIGELGGGSRLSDMEKCCAMIGMPMPTIVDVSVNGGDNSRDLSDPASGEVALDLQAAAISYWVATGKPAVIRVYYAPNASDSLAAATNQAADDGCDVFSWSWGLNEAQTGSVACMAMESAVARAQARGMVVLAASGDNGSRDFAVAPLVELAANVDSPASCPHVIACGGTRKTGTTFMARAEVAWNEGGGGFSRVFKMPQWMSGAPHGGRMVPDLAANADPDSGVKVVLNGQVEVFGGTSFDAPFLAGLIAACGEKRGLLTPDGIGPLLWANHMAFNDITKGNNGKFRAKEGPDACTGLGSPIGTRIAAMLMMEGS